MKAVILAGGKGTRISEETKYIPKPMIRLVDKPIIHHIIDEFISYGVDDFIIMTGYKQEIIFGYFFSLAEGVQKEEYYTSFDMGNYKVTLVPSGLESQTGGRLLYAKNLLREDFLFTYGDGLSDIDIHKVIRKHKQENSIVTLSGVRPVPRFGSIVSREDGMVIEFGEKQENLYGWINAGFSVMSPRIFDYINSDDCNLEKDVYPQLSSQGCLYFVSHEGFWHCVDTLRDLDSLIDIYQNKGKIWLR